MKLPFFKTVPLPPPKLSSSFFQCASDWRRWPTACHLSCLRLLLKCSWEWVRMENDVLFIIFTSEHLVHLDSALFFFFFWVNCCILLLLWEWQNSGSFFPLWTLGLSPSLCRQRCKHTFPVFVKQILWNAWCLMGCDHPFFTSNEIGRIKMLCATISQPGARNCNKRQFGYSPCNALTPPLSILRTWLVFWGVKRFCPGRKWVFMFSFSLQEHTGKFSGSHFFSEISRM